jgi:hypothetical protein
MANYNTAFSYEMYPQGKHERRYDININPSSTDTIPAVLVVDSSRRNRVTYENPGHYQFSLISPYTDVVSIELIQANIPNSVYAVNASNNVITFQFDNEDDENIATFTATIPIGDYATIDSLVVAAVLAMNTALARNSLASNRQFVAQTTSTLTSKVSILSPVNDKDGNAQDDRSVTFISGVANSADTILGIGAASVTANTTTYITTMPYSYVLRPTRYVILDIANMNRCDGNSSHVMDSFCVIPVDSTLNNFGLIKDGDTIDNDSYIYHFPSPLRQLKSMEITMKTPNGCVCDFNGRDHFLVFEIHCLSRPHKYKP